MPKLSYDRPWSLSNYLCHICNFCWPKDYRTLFMSWYFEGVMCTLVFWNVNCSYLLPFNYFQIMLLYPKYVLSFSAAVNIFYWRIQWSTVNNIPPWISLNQLFLKIWLNFIWSSSNVFIFLVSSRFWVIRFWFEKAS